MRRIVWAAIGAILIAAASAAAGDGAPTRDALTKALAREPLDYSLTKEKSAGKDIAITCALSNTTLMLSTCPVYAEAAAIPDGRPIGRIPVFLQKAEEGARRHLLENCRGPDFNWICVARIEGSANNRGALYAERISFLTVR